MDLVADYVTGDILNVKLFHGVVAPDKKAYLLAVKVKLGRKTGVNLLRRCRVTNGITTFGSLSVRIIACGRGGSGV